MYNFGSMMGGFGGMGNLLQPMAGIGAGAMGNIGGMAQGVGQSIGQGLTGILGGGGGGIAQGISNIVGGGGTGGLVQGLSNLLGGGGGGVGNLLSGGASGGGNLLSGGGLLGASAPSSTGSMISNAASGISRGAQNVAQSIASSATPQGAPLSGLMSSLTSGGGTDGALSSLRGLTGGGGAGNLPVQSSMSRMVDVSPAMRSAIRPNVAGADTGRFVGGRVGNYINELKSAYNEGSAMGRGRIGPQIEGTANVGNKLITDASAFATGTPTYNEIREMGPQAFDAQTRRDMLMRATAPMMATENLSKSPFDIEGPTGISGQNQADIARTKLQGGNNITQAEMDKLLPTAKNAYNSFSRDMGDDMFQRVTGMTKTQAQELMRTNPEEFIKAFGA